MSHPIRCFKSLRDTFASIGAAVRASRELTLSAGASERAAHPASSIPL
ncbi:hypothetical protein SAMN05880590_101321 [Rhizobium sp. RU35A]|nr:MULTISPECIES: hypothetical protein [Rhizobium]SIP93806.1 hypothetical protein SAMN05880590_101321 [Rhizobium sp. RU35A]